jgi:signal transduction histidine kinase/ActR/RegA family two-component response regulator
MNGELGYSIRVLLLAAATGYFATHHRRTPPFLVVSLLWVLVIGPLAALTHATGMVSASWTSLVVAGFSDSTAAILAGTLLLYPAIWVRFNNYPRQISLADTLVHVAPLMASFAVWVVLGVVLLSTGELPHLPAWSGVALAVLAIWLPAWVGFRGSGVLEQALQDFGAAGLLGAGRSQTFSGMASDFWRRKTLLDTDRTMVASRTTSQEDLKENRDPTFAPDKGICAISRSGTILFINRLFRELAELTTNDSIGKQLDQVNMNEALRTCIQQLLSRTFEHGARTTECRVNELPNKLRFFEVASVRADSIEDSSIAEGPDSVIITVREITDRRTVEDRLLQAQKLDSLGGLVTGIAHAFNNALTSISGQASIAHQATAPDKDRALSKILATAKDAGVLVRQLLDFAEGGPALIKPQDLGALVSERLTLLREMIGEQYTLSFTQTDSPFPICCDSNLVLQAITNLVMNSKEALGTRAGTISIALEREQFDADVSDLHVGAQAGGYARLRVRDDGPGMSPEVLARAFDPLFTTRSTSGHAGLGLSIVFAIVRAHNGFLTAESFPDRGTSISLYFPLHAAASDKPSTQDRSSPVLSNASSSGEQPSERSAGGSERILVVEDESSLRELLALMLRGLGYTVSTCGNGQEALEKCRMNHFDLLLVDMVMPKLQGLDLIAQLRSGGSSARMLLMTGYGARVDAPGADNMLAKPFDMEMLDRAVRETIKGIQPAVPES